MADSYMYNKATIIGHTVLGNYSVTTIVSVTIEYSACKAFCVRLVQFIQVSANQLPLHQFFSSTVFIKFAY